MTFQNPSPFPAPATRAAGVIARAVLGWLATVVVADPVLGQVAIELKPTVRVESAAAPITLGTIADLEGPDADQWRYLPIDVSNQAAQSTIDVEQVRSVMQQRAGVHWGKIVLRGSACTVIRPQAKPVESSKPSDPVIPAAADAGPKVRDLAADRIAQALNAAPADVRVEFADQDREILDTPVTGRVVEIQPVGKSDRMGLSVRVFEGEKIVADGTIRAKVQLQRRVAVAVAPIPRGEAMVSANTAIETRWIGAAESPADADLVLGMVAKGRLKAGQIISKDDIEPAVVVERGDLVNVDCLAGGIALRRMMRAAEQGRDGDVVELQTLDNKKTVHARMNGRGRAVMVVDQAASPAAGPGAADVAGTVAGAEPWQARVGGIQVSRGVVDNRSRTGAATKLPEGKRVARFAKLANGRLDDSPRPASASGDQR